MGIFKTSSTILFFSALPMILSLLYSLFYYNRVFFGPIMSQFIRYYTDITKLEFLVLVLLLLINIICGIYPIWILAFISV